MDTQLACFKAYDIRGRLGDELNETLAYRIGRAFAEFIQQGKVVVGGDMRLTSAGLKSALADGLMAGGIDVIDIGMVGTEEVYFATAYLEADGGIEVTASHNPIDFNGMKLVGKGAVPISSDSGLLQIKQWVAQNQFSDVAEKGCYREQTIVVPYVEHLLSYIDCGQIKPLKLVVNAGNGAAGHVIDELERRFIAQNVAIEFIKIHHQADGHFPNGIPNPLLVENRSATAEAVKAANADMGIAWDGDFDRCFLFDEHGDFIEGYYIVGLLAEAFLRSHPGSKIIHDPRLTLNTIDIVKQNHGVAIESKTGHAFIKERMRQEDAIYGGEMSAHHYFKAFNYCDSGMIPWLLVAGLLSEKRIPLSQMVSQRVAAYPCSGEINTRLDDPDAAIAAVLDQYGPSANQVDHIDGISVSFDNWRFNLRKSNTEPLLRLNVESQGDKALMQQHTDALLKLIGQY